MKQATGRFQGSFAAHLSLLKLPRAGINYRATQSVKNCIPTLERAERESRLSCRYSASPLRLSPPVEKKGSHECFPEVNG
ncbi:hypothetical protein ALP55_200023 [Pseudomonas coronafaciens pv. oryzae]|nr:hypothetical protein ALP55_200023 [Pseudomonas coronafaciens pv. oryzae]